MSAENAAYEASAGQPSHLTPQQRDAESASDEAVEAAPLSGEDPRVLTFLGEAYPTVARFAALLADQGVLRGLIGPREAPRLWDRHLLNSASVAALLPGSGTLVDVGSGAGLPGLVLAAMRPDLHVVLLEPMQRRVAWLSEVVDELAMGHVEVVRARAEDATMSVDAVTARAVAPLDRLVGWTLPLLRAGGTLLAMKGQNAQDEITSALAATRAVGGGPGEVVVVPTIEGLPGTTVVRIVRELVVP
ncbi:MAG: methyltransferase GidB, partial [Actinotalea sp.]|nr:methyltransferase GidB [Actinotalea sp.]